MPGIPLHSDIRHPKWNLSILLHLPVSIGNLWLHVLNFVNKTLKSFGSFLR